MADVRNHLVAMLEELGDPKADASVIERAKATSQVATTYISAVKTELDAIRLLDDTGRIASVVDTPERQDGRVLSFDSRRTA
jgi:hypothetical protein